MRPFSHRWRVPIAAGCALACAAGALADDPAPDPATRRVEAAYLARKWAEAKAWFAAERDDAVIARCTAILDLEPDLSWKDEVRDLRLRARERLQATDVLEAALVPEAPRVTVGEPIRCRLRLTARAADPVEWALVEGDEDPATRAVLEVRIREHGFGRIEEFAAWRVPLEGLPAAATLPQGDTLEAVVEIPTATWAPLRVTPRTYTLVATLRPARLVAGTRRAFNRVIAPSATVEAWPRGAERLAADPVASVRAALREEHAVACFLAAFVAPEATRPAVAEVLLDALGAGFERRAMLPAVCGGLRRTTGEDLPDDPAAWLAYWSRARAAAAPPAPGAGG